MGSLQELLDKATVKFPKPIDEKRSIQVLKHLTESIHCEVRYNFSGFGNIGQGTPTHYTDKIHVTITRRKSPFTAADFSFVSEIRDDRGMFSSMKFDTVGYDRLEQIPKERLEFYDLIRQRAEEFLTD